MMWQHSRAAYTPQTRDSSCTCPCAFRISTLGPSWLEHPLGCCEQSTRASFLTFRIIFDLQMRCWVRKCRRQPCVVCSSASRSIVHAETVWHTWLLSTCSERWYSSLAIPEYTFTVGAIYRTPTPRSSSFSLNVPVFQKLDEIMTEDGVYQLLAAAIAHCHVSGAARPESSMGLGMPAY